MYSAKDILGWLKCNSLLFFLVQVHDAGKYMVRATNAGGEAQSIADFAVIEPTPERMVEVVKTVVFENVKDKKVSLNPILNFKLTLYKTYFPHLLKKK